jgi:hypothetical protein
MMNDRVFKLTRLRAFRFLAVAALCSLPAMRSVAASEQFNYANGPLEGAGSAEPGARGPIPSTEPLSVQAMAFMRSKMLFCNNLGLLTLA